MIPMLSMYTIICTKVMMNQQVHICTGAQDILKCIHHTSDMTSIPAISTNHVKILTGHKDSRLRNKVAKSKVKKWTTMSKVLQDVADMAIDFERSCGYSLPTFEVQYVSSTNSSSSYRFQQADYKNHTTTVS